MRTVKVAAENVLNTSGLERSIEREEHLPFNLRTDGKADNDYAADEQK